MRAADIIAPPGIERKPACCAALFIARRFRGDDRIALLEECGLLPYEPGTPPKGPKGCQTVTTNYTRPGR